VLNWFRERREAAGLAQADADALVRTYGNSASSVARIFEHDDGTTHIKAERRRSGDPSRS